MKDESELIQGFVEYEKRRGIKRLVDLPYMARPFFVYLESLAITCDQVGRKEAQGYQTYLVALEKEDAPCYAATTVARLVSLIRRFYNYLEAAGEVFTNPFVGIKAIKTGNSLPRDIPDEGDMARLLEYFRAFWKRPFVRERRIFYKIHVIAELMYSTGLRVAEVAGLREQDIDFEKRIIHVIGKGDKPRIVYLNRYAARVLYLYLSLMRDVIVVRKEAPTIFGNGAPNDLIIVLNKYLSKASAELSIGHFTSHNFRHALGFHLLRRGADLRYIKEILGHEDMNTTTIYTKVVKEDLKDELDKYHPRKIT